MKFLALVSLLVLTLSACGEKTMEVSNLFLQDEGQIKVNSFTTDQPSFSITGTLTNVNEPFTLIANWYYLGEDGQVLIATLEEEISKGDQSFLLDITSPYQGWPEGDYKVELFSGERKLTEHSYQVEEVEQNIHPAYLVGTYYFEQVVPDAPVNIVSHSYDLRNDGTFTEHLLWSSKTMSSTSEGTYDGEWEYVDGELRFYYNEERNWHYTYFVDGNRIYGADNYWTGTTLVFSKNWMED